MRLAPRNPRLTAALFAISFSVISPAFAGSERTTPTSGVEIFNFGQVSDTYFRGAQPESEDVADLARLGIRTVIDLQRDGDGAEQELVEKAGMTYVKIPMTTRVVPTSEQIAQFLALVNDPASQPVYVHCKEGRHRTGVMTAIYRMNETRWTADQAFREMKDYRFGMDFLHPEFKRFVYNYQPAEKLAEAVAEVAEAAVAP